jgi:hypothetical protein
MAKSRNVANLIAANLLPASNTIVTSMIADGAITTDKLANTAVTTSKLNSGVTAQFPVLITNVIVTDSSYTTQADTAVAPGGGYLKLIGSGFLPGVQVYVNNTPAIVSTYVSATEVRAQVTSLSVGYYHIYVQNSNGQAGLRVNGLYVSTSPTWTTGTSIGGSVNVPFAIQLAATSDTPVTYSLAAGSTLPTGMSLTSLGYLSGTVSGLTQTTAYTISIVATDSENQTNTRTFTLTITVSEPYFPYTSLLLLGSNAGTTTQNNTFVDTSVNAATPTRFGNVTQGSFSPFSHTGWSLFNNDVADSGFGVNYTSALDLGTGDFTIEAWIYLTALPTSNSWITTSGGYQVIVQSGANSSANGWMIGFGTTNIFVEVTSDGTGPINVAHGFSIGTWYHIALTRSGTTFRLFKNGTLIGNGTNSSAMYAGERWGIARGEGVGYWTGGWLNGYLSNLRVIKGSVLAAYSTSSTTNGTAIFTPPTSPLTAVAGTLLLLCTDGTLLDRSGNNYTITHGGGVHYASPTSPFTPASLYSQNTVGGSMYFDGAGDYLSLASSALYGFGTGSFTMECWVYLTGTPGAGNWGIMMAGTANSASNAIGMYVEGSTNTFRIYNGTSTVSIGSMVPRTWYHLALVRVSTGTNQTFGFLNGVLTATTTFADTFVSPAPLYIGISVYGALNSAEYFNGYIADARVLKGAAAYTGTFTIPSAPLATSQTQSGNLAAFSSSATSALVKGINASIFDSTAKNVLETIGPVATQTTVYKYGGASIYFPGTSNVINMPVGPSLSVALGDCTIEAWVYPTATSAATIFYINGNSTSYAGYRLGIQNNQAYVLCSTNGTTWSVQSNLVGTVSLNTWTHLALVRYGGTIYLYINGQSVYSSTAVSATTSLYGGTVNSIGGQFSAATPEYYTGYLDDVRITKGVARFTANFTPATSELTAN